jgi:hypothetical protein
MEQKRMHPPEYHQKIVLLFMCNFGLAGKCYSFHISVLIQMSIVDQPLIQSDEYTQNAQCFHLLIT